MGSVRHRWWKQYASVYSHDAQAHNKTQPYELDCGGLTRHSIEFIDDLTVATIGAVTGRDRGHCRA